MKISPLKAGTVLMIIGIIWISILFVEAEKAQDSILLKQSSFFELKSKFVGTDIGYYKILIPEFVGDKIFVQILDPKNNIIQEEKIQTKMSVGYFDFSKNGIYTIKITNISKNQIDLQIEFGNTNSQEMIPAGILIVIGAVIIIVISYLKIKNYKIEQPDENIS
tara:strand:+ start:608 stop:1099 length:492 start_codon:yes stop_codon:yes gene_type:complete